MSKAVKPELILVPKALRERFERLAVCIDFKIPRQFLRAFGELSKTKGEGSFTRFSGTSAGDQEVALIIRADGKGKFHATVEFRRNAKSPYSRLSKKRMRDLVDFIEKYAIDFEIAYWEQTELLEKAPRLGGAEFEMPKNRKGRLTGFQFSVFDGETEIGGVRIENAEKGVFSNMWTRNARVNSLAEVFEKGPESARLLVAGDGDEA